MSFLVTGSLLWLEVGIRWESIAFEPGAVGPRELDAGLITESGLLLSSISLRNLGLPSPNFVM